MSLRILALAALFACFAAAQTAPATSGSAPKEEIAVIEVGGAASRGLNGGGSAAGLDFAVEWTPIEHWLELEAGTSPVFSHGSHEWDTGFLFKKPWTLTPNVEFMAGLGPEWQHVVASGTAHNSLAAEAIGDFMFWPGRGHRFGWYLEPGWDYSFGSGHERSVGISFGLLIAIH